MSGTYEFVQLDVFTKRPLTGNPLAIFPDARGLSDRQMQALAREMNLSETTFIFPGDPGLEAKEGKRVRIFTPQEELPFAGHPTLGTALYLYSTASSPSDALSLALDVGKIDIRFRADAVGMSDCVAGNVFGEMRQRDPEFGPTLPREKVAEVLGTDGSEIASEWPSQVVSTGLPFAIVPIRDAQGLANLKPDVATATALLKGTGGRFIYFICPEDRQSRHEVRARMFFYGGEDPATGSAAGCAISWMVRYGLVKSDEEVLIRQGVEAGRPSEIFVRASHKGPSRTGTEKITNVRVGGYAVEILRGTVSLPN
jgi:trans-2,3-dihydro-3-hydroxyanthranilate isomerase